LRLFKGSDEKVPVIVITAFSYEEAEEVVRAGADDFITKPINFDQLISKIERALGRSAESA
jgi:two-component system response regulator HydG